MLLCPNPICEITHARTHTSFGRLMEKRRNIPTFLQSTEEKGCPILWISKTLYYEEENIMKENIAVHLYKMHSLHLDWCSRASATPHQHARYSYVCIAGFSCENKRRNKMLLWECIPAGLPVAGEAQYQVWQALFPVTSVQRYSNKFSLWIPAEDKLSTKARQSWCQG